MATGYKAPFAFVTGLALGWMYYRTGSLLPGILMHFVNNSAAVASFLLADDPNATMVSTYGQTGAGSYGDLQEWFLPSSVYCLSKRNWFRSRQYGISLLRQKQLK